MNEFLGSFNAWVTALVAAAGAIAGVAFATRDKWSKSNTNQQLEQQRQELSRVQVEQLRSAQAELERERVLRQQDNELAAARESDLRAINESVRRQFEASLDEFRATVLARDQRIGMLIEEVAEHRGQLESLRAQIVDLQAAIQRQKSDDAEARRALQAGYERAIAELKSENANLVDRNRALVNQLYGDGTATNIMGAVDPPQPPP